MATSAERREELKAVYEQARSCPKCPELVATRTQVVFGAGNADADLMFVGEAPGANEDRRGLPFVGQAGMLLEQLLGEIGLQRKDVFIANVLKCLRYDATVQLGDGSWERIGRLVRSRYDGTVMSLDEHGALVPRRVTGWHATPLAGRDVYRLAYRSAKRAGASKSCVLLTADHPVLTERGYVAVADLRQEDRVATGQGLSELAMDVVCGTLLGDASLSARSASLTMSHGAKQASYARFKTQLLAELRPVDVELSVTAVAGSDRRYDVVQARTRAHRALGVLRAEFYRPEKVVPAWIAERLNPRMLAFWFMDDGYLRIRPPRQPSAEIATVGFSDADIQVLLRALQRLGVAAKASRRRIVFDVRATRRLSELIAPFVPSSMRYKLHPEVASAVPFDPARFERGPTTVLYDQVEAQRLPEPPGNDRTYFCLDVEETHNFVTAGGVVHNCRPPGNRDPHPVEIENCQDYLMRQLELIEPRVVCTLGNFATKLLRGDPVGITRVHGRDEVRVIGRRAVRLYPLYHPAAALYTPRMLETLREDFRRIPELLAMDPPPQPEPEELELLVDPEDAPRAVPEPAAEPQAAADGEPGAGAGEPSRPTAPSGDPDPAAERRPEPPIEGQLGLF